MRSSLIAATLLAPALALGADTIEPKPVDGLVRWVYSYEEGKRLARASDRPMFVVFRCER